MARVTIERALDKVDSRFELAVLCGYRANVLSCTGAKTEIKSNDKNAIIAIREVENETVSIDLLRAGVLNKYKFEDNVQIATNSFLSSDFAFDDLFKTVETGHEEHFSEDTSQTKGSKPTIDTSFLFEDDTNS